MLARRIALGAEPLPRGAAVAVLVNRGARSAASARWESLVAKILGRRLLHRGSLGGGLALPSGSANDDGVFELCAVQAGSRVGLLMALARMAGGRSPASGTFAVERAVRARIECERPGPFFGDGEELARGRAFDVHLRRRTLLVIC